MVRNCVVPNCHIDSRTHPGFPMFSIPKDSRRATWLENMHLDESDLSLEPADNFVCLLHFEDQYLRDHGSRVTLEPNAVPTVLAYISSSESSHKVSYCDFLFLSDFYF